MADAEDSDNDPANLDMFKEPDDFYEPEKQPTTTSYKMLDGREISLRLIGHSPLWSFKDGKDEVVWLDTSISAFAICVGHHLWQSALSISRFLERNSHLLRSHTILELGAAAGLPSIISYLHGASLVVATDYPDADLIANLHSNLQHNCRAGGDFGRWATEGYLWGAETRELVKHLLDVEGTGERGYDVLILADLLFNHSEHGKLVSSVQRLLRKSASRSSHDFAPQALVFFTPYRPWLLDKDMAFFDLAREGGFKVEKVLEEKMEKAMFEKDPGDEELRRTVFGYRLTWVDEGEEKASQG